MPLPRHATSESLSGAPAQAKSEFVGGVFGLGGQTRYSHQKMKGVGREHGPASRDKSRVLGGRAVLWNLVQFTLLGAGPSHLLPPE